NEDGSVWVVFNGEIYDYQELRRELIARGHRFTSGSDTETLVHLYEEEGIAGISKLRGMFAYAIWDSRRRKLMLARDRFGKKPLYYANTREGFYFGSELKCLRAAGVPMTMDAEAIRIYLQFGYIPDPWSAFAGIKKLPPGHWLTLDSEGGIEIGRYWQTPPPFEGEPLKSEEDICAEIRQVFDDSVRMRMIADVPLGAFLSGGIDSSLVVASMAMQSRLPVRTFAMGFEEQEFNELPYSRMVAQKYGTEHHEEIVRPDAVDLVPRLIHFFDEPFSDASAIPTYLVSKFAAGHVKVVLSGDGGDEFFGGYSSFFEADASRRYDAIPQWARAGISSVAESLPYSARGKNFLHTISRSTPLERYFESISFSFYSLRRRTLNPEWMLPTGAEGIRAVFGDAILPERYDAVSQAMHFEATAKLAGDILVKVDRMSMANSIEVRCPMLDHVLAETANRIPNAMKLRNGKGKLILLKALGDRLPPELLTRPKAGFGIPLGNWFRGPLRSMLWDSLTSKSFLDRGFTTSKRIGDVLREHDSGRRDNSFFLWVLLILQLWLADRESCPAESHASLVAPAL
ncbi:MAG TPA: asparagine synthase (glutamine-hydrolyzing), partial [Bryobacteraceae bacterium]|nr:asparagine synthase (glutamine-hydrolyzing) [Bryobacteraceae bacterium]